MNRVLDLIYRQTNELRRYKKKNETEIAYLSRYVAGERLELSTS